VPGSYVTVAIPFEGDADLFQFQAATHSSNPPRGRIVESRILVSFRDVKLDPERTRQEINMAANRIEEHLKWIRNDSAVWNGRVQGFAEQCVRYRKRRLLEQANMVSALGLPMKRHPDAEASTSVPVTRKQRPIVVPPTPREAFRPEP